MPINKKQTSPKVASKAGKDLGNKNTPEKYKPEIASALSQARKKPKKKK